MRRLRLVGINTDSAYLRRLSNRWCNWEINCNFSNAVQIVGDDFVADDDDEEPTNPKKR